MSDYWPAGRSVLGKQTVTAVLKMLAALTLRPRAAFSTGLISQFFAKRTDPEPFLSAVNWLTSGFVYATLSFNRLTRRLQNRFISNYFMLVAFSSTVNLSKIVFPV